MTRVLALGSHAWRTVAIGALAVASIATACSGVTPESEGEPFFADPNTSEYQLQIVDDGITWDEYEGATLATMKCIEDKGIPTYGPRLEDGGRFLSFDYGGLKEGASMDAILAEDRAADECIEEYLSVVGPVYSEANQPTESESQELLVSRIECAKELGYTDIPEDPGAFTLALVEHPELGVCLDP